MLTSPTNFKKNRISFCNKPHQHWRGGGRGNTTKENLVWRHPKQMVPFFRSPSLGWKPCWVHFMRTQFGNFRCSIGWQDGEGGKQKWRGGYCGRQETDGRSTKSEGWGVKWKQDDNWGDERCGGMKGRICTRRTDEGRARMKKKYSPGSQHP